MQSDNSLRWTLDHGPWTGFQRRAGMLAILAVVLDGFDIQLLGVVLPALIKEWNLPREAFVPVIGLGIVAMSVGTAINGWLGDRFGRKLTLLASMIVFGLGTLMTVMATGMPLFIVARLIASVGLGGAMPSAVALLSEFTPVRRRSFMVTLGMICTPVGGVLAGLVSAWLLPVYGWQSLFLVGGLLPLVLAGIMLVALPESPQFLASRPGRRAELERFAARLGVAPSPGDLGATAQAGEAKAGYGALFAGGEWKVTLLLWSHFLFVLTTAYTVFNWLPTLSTATGFTVAQGGMFLAAFNFGGIAGALIGALCIDRSGSRRLTISFGLGAAAASLVAFGTFGVGTPVAVLAGTIFFAGLFIAGLQPMLFAIAAAAYPVQLRGTGVGTALAVGRLGAIASSYIGAVLIGAGAGAFFVFLGAMMMAVAAALWLMPRHVPGRQGSK
ncbi:MFS transporter [Novosphingobium sp. RD2P27]|uniref:MFS transporter n=1 Tax=Novosphingobium kalidii TaxID=3230299 RepID=A0ABV2D1K7_9SPHN